MYQRPKSSDCLVISVGRSGISVSFDIRNVLLPFYVVAIGKVRAKVAAAALLPPQRGARDQQTHGDDAAEAPELAIDNARGGRGSKQRMPCVEPRDGRVDAMPLAQQTAVPPHQRPDIVC